MSMSNRNIFAHKTGRAFLLSASALAMCAATNNAAFAQEAEAEEVAEDEEEDAIVVVGIRKSLESAADIKRDADTFVDVITASDIGALPDRSVSEALQRVPGVSVLRFAGPDDPDHFAVEGAGVAIRGLPFVRSELNGRDVFGAGPGGSLGFEDVSPELLGSVVVFKNATADLIEGGAAGTVDLRTRLPFDSNDRVIALSGEINYSDFREEATPTVSGLYSDNFDTGIGRIGILGNISYSRLLSRADGVSIGDFRADNTSGRTFVDPSNPVNPPDNFALNTDTNGDLLFIPGGGGIRSQEFDRERLSYAAAFQWESNDGRWQATAQFLRSESELLWGENVVETVIDNSSPRTTFDSSTFTFDNNGVFTGGTISDDNQWRGPNATAALLPPAFTPGTGGQQIATFRERFEEDITTDYGFNLKYAPTDNLRFNFDAQYIDASTDVVDVQFATSFFAPITFGPAQDGVPAVSFELPVGESAGFFQDPSNFFLRSFLDHNTQNDADSFAFKADVEYDFSGDGFLKSVRAGARYNEQSTTIRESDFNWGNISEVWTAADINGNSGNDFNAIESILLLQGNSNPALDQALAGLFTPFNFTNFQRGQNVGFGGAIPFYSGPGADDFAGYQQVLSNILAAVGGSPSGANPLSQRSDVIPGTNFLPTEIGQIDRDNFAAYVRFDFGADNILGGVLEGNVGVRYVHTSRSIPRSLTINPFNQLISNALVDQCAPGFVPPAGSMFVAPGACDLGFANLQAFQAQFGAGVFEETVNDTSYDFFLPSFNAKLEFGGGHLIRFGYSRTLTRPTVDQLNERIFLNVLPDAQNFDANGIQINNDFGGFIGNTTGNASLLPQISDNFDLSWEWYFNQGGSLTISGFHKSISNFIAFAPLDIVTDVTEFGPLTRNGEVNTEENGRVTGVEIAYQQFYDFLPGPLSGLGIQATYTFIDSEGVDNTANADLTMLDANGNPQDGTPIEDLPSIARFAIDRDIFPRVSRHNFNIVGLYEKYGIEARAAYNWRSRFQLTQRDVIFPFNSIFQRATGQLDASIFYNINEHFKVGIQGVNLLDDITETEQTISGDGTTAPRNFFRNDRRYSLIARVRF